jgi:RNA polymerase sigma-54 factor
MEKTELVLKPVVKLQLKPYLVVKLSEYLSLKEEDIVREILEIEQEEGFQKLASLKIICRKPFSQGVFVKKENYEYFDEITPSPYDDSDVYNIINQHPDVVKLIQKIGEKKYKKFFLGYEIYTFEQIAKELSITVEEVKKIFNFTNNILIYSELQSSSDNLSIKIPEKKYVRIAKITFVNQQPVITYLSSSMLRGEYVINYDLLRQNINKFTREERKKIKELIKKLELTNVRKTTLHKIIETIISIQKEFLMSDLPERRRILTQKELAKIVGVHPSVICRMIKDKTILSPSGKEYKLTTFLPNKKEVMMDIIKDILSNKKNRHISDKELCKMIFDKTGLQIPRRTINYYRNIVKK